MNHTQATNNEVLLAEGLVRISNKEWQPKAVAHEDRNEKNEEQVGTA
jgi:hypothetical protein